MDCMRIRPGHDGPVDSTQDTGLGKGEGTGGHF